jgi:predicted DNA-binding transcriptional regulator YafY
MLFEEEQFMSEQLQNDIDDIVTDFIRRSGGKVGVIRPDELATMIREAASRGAMAGWLGGVKQEREHTRSVKAKEQKL